MVRCSSARPREDRGAAREVGVRRDRVAAAQQPVVERRAARVDLKPGRRAASRATGAAACAAARNGAGEVQHPPLLEAGPPGHQSRQTWVEAVRRIIRRPAGPDRVEVRLHRDVRAEVELQGHLGRGSVVDGVASRRDPGPGEVAAQRGQARPAAAGPRPRRGAARAGSARPVRPARRRRGDGRRGPRLSRSVPRRPGRRSRATSSSCSRPTRVVRGGSRDRGRAGRRCVHANS